MTDSSARGIPEVSVIVPVRNGAASLGPLLRSLQQQTLPAERYEVVVVDNASSDHTAALARAGGARVVSEPIPNRSRARNAGAGAARAPRFAFTDADCVADPAWLQELLAAADQAPLVAGEVRLSTRPTPNVIERYEALWRFGQQAWVREGWAATANLLVSAEAFAAVGGFDPSWRHIGEDVDFCVRARAAGWGLAYAPRAVVDHAAETRLGPLLRRCFRHGYSVNQAFYRLGLGYRAWRRPAPAIVPGRALRDMGHASENFEPREWRRMSRMAQLAYLARIGGSLWAELTRAR